MNTFQSDRTQLALQLAMLSNGGNGKFRRGVMRHSRSPNDSFLDLTCRGPKHLLEIKRQEKLRAGGNSRLDKFHIEGYILIFVFSVSLSMEHENCI